MTIARMQQRRDTAADWTSTNPILAAGEIGIETDTSRMKVGDGATAWTSLAYQVDTGPPGDEGPPGPPGTSGARLAGVRVIDGTTDTPTAADAGYLLQCTNAAGCSITINGAVFASLDIVYAKATQGQVTFVAGSGGMVIDTPETLLTEKAQAMAALVFTGAAAATLAGQLELA